ncbi:portal protein [Kushneria aurantia]|uniref:Portal protein n=1 Tax=Kushneria aurantia TaxID=504092 RepID=A0ABV6G4V7_9GAMM|nr:hypothetical protein [Kushneria aurantia]
MAEPATVEMTDDTEAQEGERQKREALLDALGGKLQRLAQEQVSARQSIEQRWLEDLRQYHGEYTPDEKERMRRNGSSQVYVNITRNKTRAGQSRLADMLLPNDDRNWAIKPTPEPQMSVMGGEADQQQLHEQAEEAARGMQRRIEDDLTEARYNAIMRDVIGDIARLGVGIAKGPIVVNRQRRAWRQNEQTGYRVLEMMDELRAGLSRLDPWDFFPDMSAASMGEAEFVFERKMLNRKQLRELAGLPGVIESQLRAVLEQDAEGHRISQDYRQDLRAITGVDTLAARGRWELWEYWGPLDKDELRSAGVDDIDDDPLIEYNGCVLFVGEHVIKASLNPLDSGELPYSVSNWEEDDASIFGFGIPYLMRDPQRIAASTWRMIMDNAGLTSGPQIVVNRNMVKPVDGDWRITPRKLWEYSGDGRIDQAFHAFNVQANQSGLYSIFEAAQQLADTQTNLPILLQGEGASGGPGAKTATGMQMLMNNSNIVLRSAVKNFDDGITEPLIRRFYDWHMAYGDDEAIKGDFAIVARGSSVLIERQEQQEKLLMLAQIAANNPEFARSTEWQGLYREIVRSMSVPAENVLKDEQTVEQEAQQQGQEMPPELQMQMAEQQLKEQKFQFEQQKAQWDAQLKQQEMQFEHRHQAAKLAQEREIKLSELALKQEMTLAQLKAKLDIDSARIQNDRETAAANLMDSQNRRQAKEQNMDMGYDSYG